MKYQPWEQVIDVYDRGHYFHRYTVVLRPQFAQCHTCLIFTATDNGYNMTKDITKIGPHNGQSIPFRKLPEQCIDAVINHLSS